MKSPKTFGEFADALFAAPLSSHTIALIQTVPAGGYLVEVSTPDEIIRGEGATVAEAFADFDRKWKR